LPFGLLREEVRIENDPKKEERGGRKRLTYATVNKIFSREENLRLKIQTEM